MLTSRGLGVVLGDLASMGFDAKWGVLGAADVGAPHQRDRIWIVGKTTNTSSIGLHNQENECVLESQGGSKFQFVKSRDSSKMADTKGKGLQRRGNNSTKQKIKSRISNSGPESNNRWCNWWDFEPDVGRVAHGVAARVDRLKAIGNGQVPEVARTAWKILINN